MGARNKTLEDEILEIEKAFKEYFGVSGSKNLESLVLSILRTISNGERGINRKLLSVVLKRISVGSDFFVYYRRRFILIGEKYLVKRRLYYLLKYSPEHFLKTDTDVKRLSSYLFNTKVSVFVFDRASKLQKSLGLHREEFLKRAESDAKRDGVFSQVEIYTDFINSILYLILLPSVSGKASEGIESVSKFYAEIIRSLEKDVKKRSKFYSYAYEYIKFIADLRVVYNNFLTCGMEDFYYKLTYDYMFLLSDISGGRDFIDADYKFFMDYCYNVLLDRYILAKEMAESYIRKLEREKDKLASSKKAKRVYLKTLEFAEQSLSTIDRHIEMLNKGKIKIKLVKS